MTDLGINHQKSTGLSYLISKIAIGFSFFLGIFLFFKWTGQSPEREQIALFSKIDLLLFLSGLSLFFAQFHQRSPKFSLFSKLSAGLVILIGILNFYELFQNIELKDVFFQGFSFNYLLLFVLLGIAELLIDSSCYNFKCLDQLFCLIAGLFSLISFSVYLYQPHLIKEDPLFSTMSLISASAVFLLSLGVLCLRPQRGLMILIASDTLGGEFVRKTFQSLLISIPVSAILIKLGQTCGFYDSTYCLYFNLLMNLIIFIGLTWYIAGELAQVDLARRKVEQKNQKDLQETQEQMKIRKDLVAIVSHDLRNPLSAMLMNSDILRRITLDPLKNSEIKAAQIKKIEHNIRFITERMYHLVVNLLDFNKIQTDTYRVEKKPFSSETLLNGVLEMFSAIGSQKNIQVQIDESREVATTYCDFEKIMQVFSNVVGNAMKFTASGGSVSLSVKKEENGVVFFVQDTGIGIPENQIKNIFEVYWQGSGKERKDGLGLGLAICKGIVESHGGKIWAESESGKGTKISFLIPN